VFDYVDGKVDWLSYGLPVEGDDGPFLIDQVGKTATCDATLTVADARGVLGGTDEEVVLVVHEGLVVGDVDAETLEGKADALSLLQVLRPVPSTVRPSVTVASVAEAGGGDRVVTTSDGRLLGRAKVEGSGHHDHDHDDHGDSSVDMEAYEEELGEVMKALAERFGDREASPDEVHAFLRERLVAEGRSPEEADQFLRQMEGQETDEA